MLMIALGAAWAAPVGGGSDPVAVEPEIEIVDANMFVPRNRVAAMRMFADGGEGELDWDVVEQPSVGEAIFDGNLLYFVPVTGQKGLDFVVISAVDEAGNEAFETIDVSVGREAACSHISGASGAMALFGVSLVASRQRRRRAITAPSIQRNATGAP
jgi:uncharacterized protein (TIGR03382 family)